eukprot:TRINITY_DN49_c0_g1_i1.p1 TRINITY_DN49_c0_g1~~TRINITY_DN49_c0_g1_i1.p1  ORF type:complete len:1499 (-),score=288.95 TRINITY_DN49_c0_g1_i1:1771-6267(-)
MRHSRVSFFLFVPCHRMIRLRLIVFILVVLCILSGFYLLSIVVAVVNSRALSETVDHHFDEILAASTSSNFTVSAAQSPSSARSEAPLGAQLWLDDLMNGFSDVAQIFASRLSSAAVRTAGVGFTDDTYIPLIGGELVAEFLGKVGVPYSSLDDIFDVVPLARRVQLPNAASISGVRLVAGLGSVPASKAMYTDSLPLRNPPPSSATLMQVSFGVLDYLTSGPYALPASLVGNLSIVSGWPEVVANWTVFQEVNASRPVGQKIHFPPTLLTGAAFRTVTSDDLSVGDVRAENACELALMADLQLQPCWNDLFDLRPARRNGYAFLNMSAVGSGARHFELSPLISLGPITGLTVNSHAFLPADSRLRRWPAVGLTEAVPDRHDHILEYGTGITAPGWQPIMDKVRDSVLSEDPMVALFGLAWVMTPGWEGLGHHSTFVFSTHRPFYVEGILAVLAERRNMQEMHALLHETWQYLHRNVDTTVDNTANSTNARWEASIPDDRLTPFVLRLPLSGAMGFGRTPARHPAPDQVLAPLNATAMQCAVALARGVASPYPQSPLPYCAPLPMQFNHTTEDPLAALRRSLWNVFPAALLARGADLATAAGISMDAAAHLQGVQGSDLSFAVPLADITDRYVEYDIVGAMAAPLLTPMSSRHYFRTGKSRLHPVVQQYYDGGGKKYPGMGKDIVVYAATPRGFFSRPVDDFLKIVDADVASARVKAEASFAASRDRRHETEAVMLAVTVLVYVIVLAGLLAGLVGVAVRVVATVNGLMMVLQRIEANDYTSAAALLPRPPPPPTDSASAQLARHSTLRFGDDPPLRDDGSAAAARLDSVGSAAELRGDASCNADSAQVSPRTPLDAAPPSLAPSRSRKDGKGSSCGRPTSARVCPAHEAGTAGSAQTGVCKSTVAELAAVTAGLGLMTMTVDLYAKFLPAWLKSTAAKADACEALRPPTDCGLDRKDVHEASSASAPDTSVFILSQHSLPSQSSSAASSRNRTHIVTDACITHGLEVSARHAVMYAQLRPAHARATSDTHSGAGVAETDGSAGYLFPSPACGTSALGSPATCIASTPSGAGHAQTGTGDAAWTQGHTDSEGASTLLQTLLGPLAEASDRFHATITIDVTAGLFPGVYFFFAANQDAANAAVKCAGYILRHPAVCRATSPELSVRPVTLSLGIATGPLLAGRIGTLQSVYTAHMGAPVAAARTAATLASRCGGGLVVAPGTSRGAWRNLHFSLPVAYTSQDAALFVAIGDPSADDPATEDGLRAAIAPMEQFNIQRPAPYSVVLPDVPSGPLVADALCGESGRRAWAARRAAVATVVARGVSTPSYEAVRTGLSRYLSPAHAAKVTAVACHAFAHAVASTAGSGAGGRQSGRTTPHGPSSPVADAGSLTSPRPAGGLSHAFVPVHVAGERTGRALDLFNVVSGTSGFLHPEGPAMRVLGGRPSLADSISSGAAVRGRSASCSRSADRGHRGVSLAMEDVGEVGESDARSDDVRSPVPL